MRLNCPNCGAQYEVEGSVIPEAGRDVQCSNCGHTWFQRQVQQEAEIAEQKADAEVTQAADVQDSAAPAAADAPASELAEPEPQQVADDKPPLAQRQPLDNEMADVLREEADLETAQRAAEAEPAAPQPEPPVDEPKTVFAERSAQLHPPSVEPASDDRNRKQLLPDIEEINSTLSATGGKPAAIVDEAAAEVRRRSGFRRGFTAAVAVFAVMALVYVYAPAIADTMPRAAPSLASYVEWINALRISVDGVMQDAVAKLTGLLAQISGDQAG